MSNALRAFDAIYKGEAACKRIVVAALRHMVKTGESCGARLEAKAADLQAQIERWGKRMETKIDAWS